MGLIRIPWTRQPQVSVGIDYGNPITLGIGGVFDTSHGNEIRNNVKASVNTSTGAIGTYGRSAIVASQAHQKFEYRASYGSVGAITIFAVVEIRALTNYGGLIACQQSSTTYAPYELRLGSGSTSGDLLFLRAASGSYKSWNAPGAIISAVTGKAQTIAVRSANGLMETIPDGFVNGVKTQLSTAASTGTGSAETSPNNSVYIGKRYDSATYLDGNIYYIALWNRAVLDSEIQSLNANPWQLFKPLLRPIWAAPAAAASIYTISSATYAPGSITATGVTPRVSVAVS